MKDTNKKRFIKIHINGIKKLKIFLNSEKSNKSNKKK